MADRIGDYVAKFLADVSGFSEGVKKGAKDSDEFTAAMVKANLTADAIGKAAEAAFRGTVAAIKSVTVKAADYGEELLKQNQITGASVEMLGGLKFAAMSTETSFETLAKGVGVLATKMDKQSDTFDRLGISVKAADGSLRPMEAVLGDVADRFQHMEGGARKSAIAQDLFGKSGKELIPLLNQGRDGLDAMRHRAEELGLVMSEKAARAGDAFNDSLGELQGATTGLSNRIGEALLPVLTRVVTAITNVVASAGQWLKANEALVTSIVDYLANSLVVVVDFIARTTESFSDLIDFAAKAAYAFGQDGLSSKLETAAKAGHSMALGLKNANDKMADSFYKAGELTEGVKKNSLAIEDNEAVTTKAAAKHKEWVDGMQKAYNDLYKIQDSFKKESWEFYKDLEDQRLADIKGAEEWAGRVGKDVLASLRAAAIAVEELRGKQLETFEAQMQGALDLSDRIGADLKSITAVQIDSSAEATAALLNDMAKVGAGSGGLTADEIIAARKRADANKDAGAETSKAWEAAMGNITSGIAKGLTDAIFHAKSFKDSMVNLAKSTAEGMLQAFLGGLLSPLTEALGKIGSNLAGILTGQGGGILSGVGGILGGAGAAAGGAATAGGVGAGTAAGGGAGGLGGLGALMTNPWTIGIAGAIGAALFINHKIGQGRETADKFVQQFQNPFHDDVLAPQVANFNALFASGGLDVGKAQELKDIFNQSWTEFGDAAVEFGKRGGNEHTVVSQMFTHMVPLIQQIQRDMDAKISTLRAAAAAAAPAVAAGNAAAGNVNTGSSSGPSDRAPIPDWTVSLAPPDARNILFGGSFASGIDDVPRDMAAYIHRGEAVLTAADNGKLDMMIGLLRDMAQSGRDLVVEMDSEVVARIVTRQQNRMGRTGDIMQPIYGV